MDGQVYSKPFVSVNYPLHLTQAPKPATVEEARDRDSGPLGPVSRLVAWQSDGSTGFGVRKF